MSRPRAVGPVVPSVKWTEVALLLSRSERLVLRLDDEKDELMVSWEKGRRKVTLYAAHGRLAALRAGLNS